MDSLKLGDPVWAKMKGFPWWPGRIVEPSASLQKSRKSSDEICVYFFGTHNHGWIENNQLQSYDENKDAFKKAGKSKGASFAKATKEIESYISDPTFVPIVSTPKAKKSLSETNNGQNNSVADVSINDVVDEANDSVVEPPESPVTPAPVPVTKAAVKRPNSKPQQQPKKTKASYKEEPEDTPVPTKRVKKESITPVASSSNHNNNNDDSIHEEIKNEIASSPVVVARTSSKAARAVINRPTEIFDEPVQEELDVATITDTLKSKNIKPSKSKFGFIGLGIMGQGIVKNLINSGHDVCVYNRTQTKTSKFEKVGAKVVLTPSDVIEYADITFSCVADPAALKNTMFGNYGISSLSHETTAGKGYVEMTTIDTNTSKDIESCLSGSGIRYLEAQIQGTKAQAEEGKLILLAAGDKTLFEECQTCFEAMGRNSYFVGETGNATKMNLVLQTIAGIQIAGLADAMALAERADLSTDKLMEVLASTNLKSDLIMEKGAAMLDRSFTNVCLPLMHIQKDLRLAINMADALNLPMPVAAIANEGYKNARRLGLSESDASAIYYRAKH